MERFTDSQGEQWKVAIAAGMVVITNRNPNSDEDQVSVIIPAEDADMLARLIAAAGARALATAKEASHAAQT
jgi:hypothetical protein